MATVPAYDWGIAAGVIIVIAVLVYRIVRKDPIDRIVRLGVFIERVRNGKPPADEAEAETRQWPRHDPPL